MKHFQIDTFAIYLQIVVIVDTVQTYQRPLLEKAFKQYACTKS